MNPVAHPRSRPWCLLPFGLAASFAPLLSGQAVSPPPAPLVSRAAEPDVVLSPFEVVADPRDTYEALNFSSLSGTNRPLDKLPVTAEVINATLLADLAVTDTVEMLNKFATGIGPGENSPGSSSATGSQDGDRFAMGSFTVRGLDAGPVRRNGFLTAGNLSEAFTTERMEIIRGPQSLLFGAGSTGGVINLQTKKAQFGRTFLQTTARVDSLGSQRWELDANLHRRVRDRRVALRLGAVQSDQNFWRELLYRETKGYFGEVAVELFPASNTVLRFEVEDRISEGVESKSQNTVSGIPTVVANNSSLSVLLANGSPALSQIAGGRISWENVDSLAGNSNASRRHEQFYTATLSSRLAAWLHGQVMAIHSPVGLKRETPNTFQNLRAPLTGGNPFNAWATGYLPAGQSTNGNWTKGLRALLTADFPLSRHTKNNLVLGADAQRARGRNFNFQFYEADANGKILVNPSANLNTATAGRTAMPVQWVNIETSLPGFVELWRDRYVIDGRTFVKDEIKHANPALATPDNPLGYNGGTANASFSRSSNEAAFAALFTTWFGGRLVTMAGARYDRTENTNVVLATRRRGADPSGNLGFVWNLSSPVAFFAGYASNFRPNTTGQVDQFGATLPSGRGEGREAGFKLNAFEGRLSGSVAYFYNESKNDAQQIAATTRDTTDPSGINGRFYNFNPFAPYGRESRGVEILLTARPVRDWRVQLGGTHAAGRESGTVYLPFLYNDEFRTNTQGQVLLADGTPLLVPISTAVRPAADGRTYAAGVATQILTVTMLKNGDANGNYRASLAPANGGILNAAALGLTVPGVGTGRVGLPVAQHQLGFRPPTGETLLARAGGDRTIGYPRDSLTTTSIYRFSRGALQGVSLGANASLNLDTLLYYYVDAAAGNVRRQLFAPDRASMNLIAGYERKLSRKVAWKTQLNLNNAFDERNLLRYPNVATGVIDNAALRTDPRKWIWTNTLTF